MPWFGKISLSNSFLSQNRMGKGVQEVYFSLGGGGGGGAFIKTVIFGHLK